MMLNWSFVSQCSCDSSLFPFWFAASYNLGYLHQVRIHKAKVTVNFHLSPCSKKIVFILVSFLIFNLYFRERVHEQGRGAWRERKNLKQAPCLAQIPMQGSIPPPWDHDLNPHQETDPQPTEPSRHSFIMASNMLDNILLKVLIQDETLEILANF